MIYLPRERLGDEWSVQPRQWSTIALHPKEDNIDIADHFMYVPVEVWVEIIRISRTDNRLAFQVNEVGNLGSDIQIGMFTKKGNPGDASILHLDLFQLINLCHLRETDILQDEL
nr:hypothetical protein [uncultured bacterium]